MDRCRRLGRRLDHRPPDASAASLAVEGGDGSFTAKAAPVKKSAALPDVSFRLANGRPNPFAAAGMGQRASRWAGRIPAQADYILFSFASTFQSRPRISRWHDPRPDRPV